MLSLLMIHTIHNYIYRQHNQAVLESLLTDSAAELGMMLQQAAVVQGLMLEAAAAGPCGMILEVQQDNRDELQSAADVNMLKHNVNNKKVQLTLTNPRDVCETIAWFM